MEHGLCYWAASTKDPDSSMSRDLRVWGQDEGEHVEKLIGNSYNSKRDTQSEVSTCNWNKCKVKRKNKLSTKVGEPAFNG